MKRYALAAVWEYNNTVIQNIGPVHTRRTLQTLLHQCWLKVKTTTIWDKTTIFKLQSAVLFSVTRSYPSKGSQKNLSPKHQLFKFLREEIYQSVGKTAHSMNLSWVSISPGFKRRPSTHLNLQATISLFLFCFCHAVASFPPSPNYKNWIGDNKSSELAVVLCVKN